MYIVKTKEKLYEAIKSGFTQFLSTKGIDINQPVNSYLIFSYLGSKEESSINRTRLLLSKVGEMKSVDEIVNLICFYLMYNNSLPIYLDKFNKPCSIYRLKSIEAYPFEGFYVLRLHLISQLKSETTLYWHPHIPVDQVARLYRFMSNVSKHQSLPEDLLKRKVCFKTKELIDFKYCGISFLREEELNYLVEAKVNRLNIQESEYLGSFFPLKDRFCVKIRGTWFQLNNNFDEFISELTKILLIK